MYEVPSLLISLGYATTPHDRLNASFELQLIRASFQLTQSFMSKRLDTSVSRRLGMTERIGLSVTNAREAAVSILPWSNPKILFGRQSSKCVLSCLDICLDICLAHAYAKT